MLIIVLRRCIHVKEADIKMDLGAYDLEGTVDRRRLWRLLKVNLRPVHASNSPI